MRRVIPIFLVIVIVATLMTTSANVTIIGASSNVLASNNKTVTANFSDDCIIVVVSNKTGRSNISYSVSDFAEIGCERVINLSASITNIEKQLFGEDANASKLTEQTESVTDDYIVGNDEDNEQILYLELSQTGIDKVFEAIKLLECRADVICASPNYLYTVKKPTTNYTFETSEYLQVMDLRSVTTNDPYRGYQWALEKIQLTQAWGITTGTERRVSVGIIDGGVDAGHTELNGVVNSSKSATIHKRLDVISENEETDTSGHGTMIAGIIGAKSNNYIGVSGINWNVDLVSLRMNCDGEPLSSAMIITTINYAEEQDIKVLNLSLRLELSEDWDEQCDHEIYDNCLYHCVSNYSGLVICAAGNDDVDIDEASTENSGELNPVTFGTVCHDLDNVIVVGASTQFDYKWSQSNYGSEQVHIYAPGEAIFSTMSRDRCNSNECIGLGSHFYEGYHADSGTSYAAPYVAGVASLIWSKYPDLNAAEVKERILNGVDMKTSFFGKCVTGGRLNAYKALHNHDALLGYDYNDGLTHKVYCSCGAHWYQSHTWIDLGDMLVCSGCGFY